VSSASPTQVSDKQLLEVYQAFMTGYVRRINAATLNVPISGVRIGSAKHSRLAQINLSSRVITFSRYAIENVPERARRYLVIHELAHVLEASHNQLFWQIVARYEPGYRQVGKQIQLAFAANVKSAQDATRLQPERLWLEPADLEPDLETGLPSASEYICHDDEFNDGAELGTMQGGWDFD